MEAKEEIRMLRTVITDYMHFLREEKKRLDKLEEEIAILKGEQNPVGNIHLKYINTSKKNVYMKILKK